MNKHHTPQIKIGEHLLFIVSRREIVDTESSNKIKLQVPASLCLERLLLKRGEIVSQEELILCGWGEKRNASVSANAYYQCILHLRKSFTNMGLSDFIVTVPRMGLKISDSITISFLPDAASLTAPQSPDISPALTDEWSENGNMLETSSQNDAITDIQDLAQSTATQKSFEDDRKTSQTKSASVITSALALIILLTVGVIMLLIYHDSPDRAFKDYARVSSGACNIFVSDQHISPDIVIDTLRQAGITCSNNSTALATSSPMGARLNIIYCPVYSDKKQNCRSLTVMKNI